MIITDYSMTEWLKTERNMTVEPFIRFKNVNKTYHVGSVDISALHDVNFEVEKGEICIIVGASGAGKTTLLNILGGMDSLTSGEVWLDGKNIAGYNEKELTTYRRYDIGFVFQFYNLIPNLTALENVELATQIGKDPADPATVLEEVGLGKRKDNFPAQLSGGEQQRVAIARALATNPQVLLCDEATSALDPATTDSILSLIKDINRDLGITAVIITHEMSVIEKICSHVAIIHRGKIVEHGEVEEVFFHPRTEAARRLVMPEALQNLPQENLYRLIFNGRSSFEPVIANMVLECHCPVNIMYADTRDIGGIAFGQMVLQLPECPESRRSILEFAKSRNILLEEMKHV